MGNTTAGYFLIWLTHLIWHVVLLFWKLSFLLLSIPISYLSQCGLPTQIISGILFTGLILIVFLPLKPLFNPHEHRLRVISLYKALEVQLFREMCPPIINNNYQKAFEVSIMDNYSAESILLFCMYESKPKKEVNNEQWVNSFLHHDYFDKLNGNHYEKQKNEAQRNVHKCSSELRTQRVEVLKNTDADCNNDDKEFQNINLYLKNDRSKIANEDENCGKIRENKSDTAFYADKKIELNEEKKMEDSKLNESNIKHYSIENIDEINKSRSLVEAKAFEPNGICNAIAKTSHNKIIDNERKFDANESIPECVEQVEKVIAVINADSLSDDMENYAKLENCSREARNEDLIAIMDVLPSDDDLT